MIETTEAKKAFDTRVKELNKLSKVQLAGLIRARGTLVWSAAPPEKWSKDELMNDILHHEHPEVW